MEDKIIRCPICEKIVEMKSGWKSQRLAHVNGITITVGYSIGGWGSRRDFIPEQTMEVCDECFDAIKEKVYDLKKLLQERKGINKTDLYFVNRSGRGAENNSMPNMQKDKPSPEGHFGKILRLLS